VDNEELARIRRDYNEQGLDMDDIPADGKPHSLFQKWLDEAVTAKVVEPNAMCVSTIGLDGHPSARYVLLKMFDERGFVWFTNYDSEKAAELEKHDHAAITFWWGDLERSVRVRGKAAKIPAQESDDYFSKRPRGA